MGRVEVDGERCQGHARCWSICPEVFALDDGGHAHAVTPNVPDHLVDRVVQAVNACPERAISFDEA